MMDIDQILSAIPGLSDENLDLGRRAISSEQLLRRRLDASPEKIENAIAEYQKVSGKGTGEQWEQPVTALQAYRQGAEVEHEGRVWVSTHGNNVHFPGQSGWRLKPELDEDGNEIPPEYVAPSGAHDAYQKGELITWDGDIYAAVRDGVVHSPAEYAPDWKLIEPEPEPEPEDPEDPGEDENDEPTEPDEPGLPEWEVGYDYSTGDEFTYEGERYKVLQGHTSAAHWTPDAVASLYERQ